MIVYIFWMCRNANGLSREDLGMLWNFKIQWFTCGKKLNMGQH